MSKLSRIFKSEKRQKEESQEKLNEIVPEYQKKLNALNNEFGVLLTASIEVTPMGIFPKIKIILAEDIQSSSPPQQGVPPVQK